MEFGNEEAKVAVDLRATVPSAMRKPNRRPEVDGYLCLLLLALLPLALRAQDAAAPPATPPAAPSTLPGDGFEASKYKILWTKSPFSVASAEAAPDSADYSFVGMAQIDGISYACLVDKGTGDHFLITSEKPVRGLTLQSITNGKEGTAVLLRNGETLSLKMDVSAANQVAMPNQPPPPPGMPQGMQPGMLPPGARSPYPNLGRPIPGQPPGFSRARPRHRPITVPPRAVQPGQPVPNQAPVPTQ